MSYAEAVEYLCRESGWTRRDVEANPTSAGWKIMQRVWEACHAIEDGNRCSF